MQQPPRDESTDPVDGIPHLIAAARDGSVSDLGPLFEATRRYLLLVANRSLDSQLHQKVAPSDLVQETFIDAQRDFQRFEGRSEAELFGWLCQILLHKASDAGRHFRGTAKRNIGREKPIDEGSSTPWIQVEDGGPTPSRFAIAAEDQQQLVDAIGALPEEYGRVIELRNWQRLSFAEIGRRMSRSDEAARKLWFRAVNRLRDELKGRHDSRSEK